jgi:hypothetical protein
MNGTLHGNDSSSLERIGEAIPAGAVERIDYLRTAERYRT